jgi:hypothetical protein
MAMVRSVLKEELCSGYKLIQLAKQNELRKL